MSQHLCTVDCWGCKKGVLQPNPSFNQVHHLLCLSCRNDNNWRAESKGELQTATHLSKLYLRPRGRVGIHLTIINPGAHRLGRGGASEPYLAFSSFILPSLLRNPEAGGGSIEQEQIAPDVAFEMARPASPHNMSPPAWSRLRSKEYTYAAVAALVVLIYFFFFRHNGSIHAPADFQSIFPIGGDGSAADDTPVLSSPALADDTGGLSLNQPMAGSTIGGSSGGSSVTGGGISQQQQQQPQGPPPPAADRPKAVIVESSMIPNLIPVMLHFATVLGPAWGMVLFTLRDNWVEPLSAPFQRLQDEGRVEVRFLPEGTKLADSGSVSRFLTSPWLWEQVIDAKRVLLFQSDSILCARSEERVEDYFKYDLVGAPIAEQYGQGFNGGLSVRNPRVFLNVTRSVDFASSGHEFEDQYFYAELKKAGAELPTVEAAMTFAVETMYYETPLGYHQPQRWQAAKMGNIEEWCPEVKMLIGRRAQ